MDTIHFVDGGCSNVGKSLFSSFLVEYYLERGRKYKLIDLDIKNPDVERRYQAFGNIVSGIHLGDKNDETSDIISEFEGVDLICNLAPLTSELLNIWYALNPIEDVTFIRWFLCDGSFKSINIFKQLLNDRQRNQDEQLIYVHNLRYGFELSDEFRDEIESNNVSIVELPLIQISDSDRDLIDNNPAIYYSKLALSRAGMYRFVSILKEMFDAFDYLIKE